MTARGNGTSGAAVLQGALAALLAAAMVAAYCLPAEALAEALEDGRPTDIASEWAAGALTISEAGSYTLSADVETDGALTILADEGEQIELDLAGHSVTVEGDVFCGIDVSGSLGSVSIVDSEYDADDEGAERAEISVTATCAEGDVAGVLACYELPGDYGDGDEVAVPSLALEGVAVSVTIAGVSEDTAEEEHAASAVCLGYADADDPRDELDAALVDVAVSAELAVGGDGDDIADGAAALDEESAGVAYGVYTSVPGIAIDGAFSADGPDGCLLGLCSPAEGAFALGADFWLDSETCVYAAGNEVGAVFASVDEGLEVTEELLGLLVDGSGAGNVLKLSKDGGALVFAEGEGSGEDAEGAATISSVIEGLLEGAAADDSEDASETISSALAALSAATEDEEDADGSTLSTLSEGSTWTVTDSSGATVGSYSEFDDAESALADGGTVTLGEDLSDTVITFDTSTSGSFTIDLAGHALSSVTYSSSSTLTLTSSVDGGTLTGDAGSTYYPVNASSSGTGTLTVKDLKIAYADDSTSRPNYGVYSASKAGDVYLEDVDITLRGSFVKNVYVRGVSCSGTGLSMTGCSITVANTSISQDTYGAYVSGDLTMEDCEVSVTSNNSNVAYGMYSSNGAVFSECDIKAENDGSGSAYGLASRGSTIRDCTLSADTVSGAARGVSATANTTKLTACSCSATTESGTAAYGLWGGKSVSGITFDGACSFSGASADLCLYVAVTLSSNFSVSEDISVYNPSQLSGDVFATLADGLDGETLAKMFEPASGSYYEGYETVASSDGSSLEWSTDVEKEQVDLYEVLTEDDVPLSSNVTLDSDCSYYLSKDVNGFGAKILCYDGAYEIDLRGNSLIFTSGGQIRVTPTGTYGELIITSTDGEGTAKQGTLTEGALYLDAYASLSMSNVDFNMKSGTPVSYLNASIFLAYGSQGFNLDSCNIDVSYSGSSGSSMNGGYSYNNVSAIRAMGTLTSSSSITDTTISASSASSYDAVALYICSTSGTLTVKDSNFSATSTGGCAVAVYNDKMSSSPPKLTLEGEVELSATGANTGVSIGLLNIMDNHGEGNSYTGTGKPVTLDCTMSFSSNASAGDVALASDVQPDTADGALKTDSLAPTA